MLPNKWKINDFAGRHLSFLFILVFSSEYIYFRKNGRSFVLKLSLFNCFFHNNNFYFCITRIVILLNYEEVAYYLYLKLWEKAVIWTIMWIVANVRAFMTACPRFMTVEDTNENWWMTWNRRTCRYQRQFLTFILLPNLAKKFSADQFREECSRMCLFFASWKHLQFIEKLSSLLLQLFSTDDVYFPCGLQSFDSQNNEKGWKGKNSGMKKADKYGFLGSSVTCKL